MVAPLNIRFATDTEGARSAVANLSASIASNMVTAGSAIKAVNDNVGATVSLVQRMSAAFSAALPALVAVAGAVAAFKLVEAATDAAKASIAEFVEIATKARDAGVSAGLFQRWMGEAQTLNTEASKLIEVLNRAREAGTVRIGEGDAGASSAIGNRLTQNVLAGNLGQGDLDRFTSADGQEAKIRVILDLIRQLQDKGAQLAALDLAGKMFGADFENKMRAGVDVVGKLRAALDSTATTVGGNRIVSDDELRNAQAISDQLNRISDLLAQGLAPIQRDLVELGQASYRGWLDIQEGIAGAVRKAGELYTAVKGVLGEIDKITGKDPLGSLATTLGAGRIRNALGIAEPDGPVQGPMVPPGGLRLTVNPKTDTSRSLPSLSPKGTSGATESKDEIERLIAQMDRANEVAKAELDVVGKTNVEREKALGLAKLTAAARAAGRDATDEERTKVDQLADATARLKDRTMDQQQKLRESAEAMREFGQIGVEAISDMLLEGRSLDDVFANLSKQIARMALQAALLGTGPLAGLFGTSAAASSGPNAIGGGLGLLTGLFKGGSSAVSASADSAALLNVPIGFNAEGTDDWRGGLSWVGEKGPELLNLPRGAQVIPNMQIPSLMNGGAPTIHIGGAVIDARGADPGVEARLRMALAESNRVQAAQLSALIRDRRGRGAI